MSFDGKVLMERKKKKHQKAHHQTRIVSVVEIAVLWPVWRLHTHRHSKVRIYKLKLILGISGKSAEAPEIKSSKKAVKDGSAHPHAGSDARVKISIFSFIL